MRAGSGVRLQLVLSLTEDFFAIRLIAKFCVCQIGDWCYAVALKARFCAPAGSALLEYCVPGGSDLLSSQPLAKAEYRPVGAHR